MGVKNADGSLERARKTQEGRVPVYREAASAAFEKVRYTEDMQKAGYTILVPQMAPIHFDLIEELFKSSGYNVVLLPSVDQGAVEAGLKYVNNDICYPSILVTGQIMGGGALRQVGPLAPGRHHHPDRRRLPSHQLHTLR